MSLFVGFDRLVNLAVDGHQVLGIIGGGVDLLLLRAAAQISQTSEPGCLFGGDRAAGDIRHLRKVVLGAFAERTDRGCRDRVRLE